jgi:hypothetical protein
MNKKYIKIALITIFAAIASISVNLTTFAAEDPSTLSGATVDKIILPRPGDSYVKTLPKVSIESMTTTVIKNVLAFTLILTTLALIVAGIYYLISESNEEQTGKAKKILLYLVIGMAIIGASYAVVSGITRFKFLE